MGSLVSINSCDAWFRVPEGWADGGGWRWFGDGCGPAFEGMRGVGVGEGEGVGGRAPPLAGLHPP